MPWHGRLPGQQCGQCHWVRPVGWRASVAKGLVLPAAAFLPLGSRVRQSELMPPFFPPWHTHHASSLPACRRATKRAGTRFRKVAVSARSSNTAGKPLLTVDYCFARLPTWDADCKGWRHGPVRALRADNPVPLHVGECTAQARSMHGPCTPHTLTRMRACCCYRLPRGALLLHT